MIRRALAVGVSGVALVLAGCGGSDTPETLQQQVAAKYNDQLSAIGGLTVDDDCIEQESAKLSDEQAQTVLDALENDEKLPAEFEDFNDAVSACTSS